MGKGMLETRGSGQGRMGGHKCSLSLLGPGRWGERPARPRGRTVPHAKACHTARRAKGQEGEWCVAGNIKEGFLEW